MTPAEQAAVLAWLGIFSTQIDNINGLVTGSLVNKTYNIGFANEEEYVEFDKDGFRATAFYDQGYGVFIDKNKIFIKNHFSEVEISPYDVTVRDTTVTPQVVKTKTWMEILS